MHKRRPALWMRLFASSSYFGFSQWTHRFFVRVSAMVDLWHPNVFVEGATAIFEFRGKSGKKHQIEVTDRRLATIVRKCQDLPGQRFFEYPDAEGKGVEIGSEM